jgi:DUF1680 family protein
MKGGLCAAIMAAFLLGGICVPEFAQTEDGRSANGKQSLAWYAQSGNWRNEGVIYLDHSLNARLHTVPLQAVHLGEGFWAPRRKVVTERGLPLMLTLLEAHGVVDNFRRLSGRKNVTRKGPLSTDADLYKWIEAASWAIASNETPPANKTELQNEVDSLISDIVAAQEPSGYLNTYFVGDKAHQRFTDLTHSYEAYCLGHLIDAGIAYFRATGNRTLLDAAVRFADYLVNNFGPTKRPLIADHPDLEMALVELYRTTGQSKYLEFTQYLFSGIERDRLKLKDLDIRYSFGARPFTSHIELEGPPVSALYAAAGATDYFAESGDPAYKKTLDALWTDLTLRKISITGGVGLPGEGWGDAFELSHQPVSATPCTAIPNVMWAFRMLTLTGDARYADVLERALYNGANSGMSLSGTSYCDRNPATANGERWRNGGNEGACCALALQQLFEVLPDYIYALSRDGVYVTLYHNSELDWHLEDGSGIQLLQATNYPWGGDVQITLNPQRTANFVIYLRWPGWAPSANLAVNGIPIPLSNSQRGTYVPISRAWRRGDTVQLSFPMQPIIMAANPRLTNLYGRGALMRGPLVYAAEQADQNNVSLSELFLRIRPPILTEWKGEMLGGITVLKVPGYAVERNLGDEPLYEPLSISLSRNRRPVLLTLIPYYAIANRESTPMEVWIPIAPSDLIPIMFSPEGVDAHRTALR